MVTKGVYNMRLDKYLKVSRIIKRRTVAKEVCDAGRIELNGRVDVYKRQSQPCPILQVQIPSKSGLGD